MLHGLSKCHCDELVGRLRKTILTRFVLLGDLQEDNQRLNTALEELKMARSYLASIP